jgi:hypothetical protein
VQPWRADRGPEATVISEHATAADAFEALDALAERMVQTGVRAASPPASLPSGYGIGNHESLKLALMRIAPRTIQRERRPGRACRRLRNVGSLEYSVEQRPR